MSGFLMCMFMQKNIGMVHETLEEDEQFKPELG